MIALAVMMVVAVLLPTVLNFRDRDYTHRFPPAAPTDGNGFAAVAGEYHTGASWTLSILPDGRYSFIWSGCFGVYHRESGTLKRVSEFLMLSPAKAIEARMDRVFLPVRWGRRSYLIPPERLEEFCDAIVQGQEPTHGRGQFYLQGSDDQVTGLPELPERWATHLRNNLVIGTIVAVTEDRRATVDVGSAEGIRVGTFLSVQGLASRMSRQLKAVSVKPHSCVVEDLYPGELVKPVGPGWKVIALREAEELPDP